jgi:hypothetical protein
MRLFGVSLMASRYALFAAFVCWLPLLWWIAARRTGPQWAAVLTIASAWWSLTVYPAAMPSWYLLFLGTGCVAALDRWRDRPLQLRWLALAGALGGLAIIVKQTGLYVLAGTALALLFCDQDDAREFDSAAPRTDPLVLALLAVLAAVVVRLLASRITRSGEQLNLLAPVMAMIALAAWRERKLTGAFPARRSRLVIRTGVVFAAAFVPVATFALWFYMKGASDMLFVGVVSDGWRRIASLQLAMPSAVDVVRYGWPVVVLGIFELKAAERFWSPLVFTFAGMALVVLAFLSISGYLRVWYAAVALLPIAVAVIAWRTVRTPTQSATVDPIVLATAAMTVFLALNQYPFSAANYYAYVVPLVFLSALLVARSAGAGNRIMMAATAFTLFGGTLNRIGSVHTVGFGPVWWDDAHLLATPRGRLKLTVADSSAYTRMLALVAEHRGSGAMLAGPELPEVYFLADNPVAPHDAYELLRPSVTDSTAAAAVFARDHITVLVIKPEPMFAHPLPGDVSAWIGTHYPHHETLGAFEVRWQ